MRKEDFSRQRKVGFGNTILIILNKTGKGLNAAIRTFRETIQKENENSSKQAFSKGRMRIKWEALREIFHDTVKEFYAEFDWKKYKGYRILAVDGTKNQSAVSCRIQRRIRNTARYGRNNTGIGIMSV